MEKREPVSSTFHGSKPDAAVMEKREPVFEGRDVAI